MKGERCRCGKGFDAFLKVSKQKEEETEGLSATSRGSSSMRDFLALFVTKNNRFFSVKFLIGLAILSCVDTLVRSFYKMHTNDMHFIDVRLKDGGVSTKFLITRRCKKPGWEEISNL